ncbi:MAG: hypothetical protein HOE90_21360 [Bacteriovoracaceae bacterium]|jgi:uncharacterized protein RhaS with RHS repeats|nr:hypothetical protein [Bacteriovoracaceae bacterium]
MSMAVALNFPDSPYDPNSARFLSLDPSGLYGGDTNLYRYALNNPSEFVDPSGNVSLLAVLGAVAVTVATYIYKDEIKATVKKAQKVAADPKVQRSTRIAVSGATAVFGFGVAATSKNPATIRVGLLAGAAGAYSFLNAITNSSAKIINDASGSELLYTPGKRSSGNLNPTNNLLSGRNQTSNNLVCGGR